MFSTLLLAATSRCASLLLCPTDTELIDALLAHDSTVRKVAADEALRKGLLYLRWNIHSNSHCFLRSE